MSSLVYYSRKFSKLHTAKVKGRIAPHKAILLLAIIEEIKNDQVRNNRIFITPELVARFKDLWSQLVADSYFTANFSLPFYHLKSEGFWHLQTRFGRELILTSSHSIKSFAQLKEVIEFAYFDQALFNLLCDEHTRNVLNQTLLSRYFPNHEISKSGGLIETITQQILHEPAEIYKTKAAFFDDEEVFVRGGIFKKQVPKIYNYACCISGLRIMTDKDVQMVDACHIVPFSISGDDTIGNGISLCPNLHRAFDRGLIAISDDYRVALKPFFEEDNAYSIKQFEGKELTLPRQKEFYPLLKNLRKHRERFGFVN
jgi:putative restriction endonuclease